MDIISYKTEVVNVRGIDLHVAYLVGNTFEYKEIIKKYKGNYDKFKKRWFWWLGETKEQIELTLKTKVEPCINEINGETKGTTPEVENIINAIDNCFDIIQDSGIDSEDEAKRRLKNFKEELINITTSEEFQQKMEPLIKFRMANNYQYSFTNTILIWLQDPEATLVKAKGGWAKFNREILPNAKKLWLWMRVPIPFNKREREEEINKYLMSVGVRYYKDLSDEQKEELSNILKKGKGVGEPRLYNYWTDVRFTKQMEGKEDLVGSPNHDLEWFEKGEATQKTEKLFDLLFDTVINDNIKIEYKDDLGGARGVSLGGKILLLANEPKDIGMVNTLCHEFAHELLHQDYEGKPDELKDYFIGTKQGRSVVEQQAELCAWIVLKEFGYHLNTSINYVGIWGLNKDNAVTIFDTVASVATKITTKIINNVKSKKVMSENIKHLKEHTITGLDVAKLIGCEDIYLQSARKQKQNMEQDQIITECIKKAVNKVLNEKKGRKSKVKNDSDKPIEFTGDLTPEEKAYKEQKKKRSESAKKAAETRATNKQEKEKAMDKEFMDKQYSLGYRDLFGNGNPYEG